MPELHAPKNSRRPKKIVGRGQGSGRGGTSGKGHKGQNSRAGGSVRPGFEGGQMPLYRRVARRGFSNYPFKRVAQPVNLFQLEGAFGDGETVSLESLREKNVIGRRVDYVKILANGEVTKKLTVQGLKVSGTAAQKIVAAGGSVEGFEPATEATTATEQAADAQAGKAAPKSKSKSGSKKAAEAEKKDEPAAEESSSDAKASAESSDAEETTEEQNS